MKNRAEYIRQQYHPDMAEKDLADQQVLWDIFQKTSCNNREKAPVTRMADYLEAVSVEFPVRINDEELLIGTDVYELPFSLAAEQEMYTNDGHYAADYDRFLRIGVEGVREIAENACPAEPNAVTKENQQAFLSVLRSFSRLILRYAEHAALLAQAETRPERQEELRMIAANCRHISEKKPDTFFQALQLVYFTQIFLHIEGLGGNSMSFGRMDQYLYRFYKRDVERRVLDEETAEEWLMCFCEKTSHCDVSQNLALGGLDRAGKPVENELTRLFIRAQRKTGLRQPSLSLLVHPQMSDALWEEALQCVATGIGMPAFFGDETVIKSLQNMGASLEDARDYAIIGCYEANPQGNAYGKTTALGLDLPKLINDFLAVCHGDSFPDFEAFFIAFLKFTDQEFREKYLPQYQAQRTFAEQKSASPFWACLAHDCLESGYVPEQYGLKYNWIGLNMYGIGTLIDSLYVIQTLVFEEKKATLNDLYQQVSQNFPDENFHASCRHVEGKFGTGSARSHEIARRLTEHLGHMALDARLEHDVRLHPSLFRWMYDVETKNYPATPDGRKAEERLSYGAAPSEMVQGLSPTSVLTAVCSQQLDLFANGCPVTISLSPGMLNVENTRKKIRHLIETYCCELGGFHVQINVQDAQVLKDAKQNPEKYPNLLIRISGHSNYFVCLNEQLQDALIARTEGGR